MRILLLLFLTLAFTQELEVEGNLKVTGNIDAQNNPIKNVGIPQELTDAINGNALQDALRDDGPYEYMFLYLSFENLFTGDPMLSRRVLYIVPTDNYITGNAWDEGGMSKLTELSAEGWEISKRMQGYEENVNTLRAVYELRRKLEE